MEEFRDIVEEYGTPVYVTDLNEIRNRYRKVRDSLNQFTIKYASKSNFDPLVVSEITDMSGEVVAGSTFEAKFLKKHGIHPSNIQVTAVSPRQESIEHMVEFSNKTVKFTVSVNEYDTLEKLINSGYRGQVLLRLKSDVKNASKYSDGGSLKFGMTPEEVTSSVALVKGSNANMLGFHAHRGGSFLTEGIDNFVNTCSDLVERCREYQSLDETEVINFGGGLGIPYHEYEEELDLQVLNRKLQEEIPVEKSTEFVLEPGRFVSGPTTVLLTEVRAVREQEDGRFVGVDAGMSEFPRPTMFDVHHEIENLTSDDEALPQTVAGPTCSGADVFCHNRHFNKASVGDVLTIKDVGAYGQVMSSNFHAYPNPTVVTTDGQESPVSNGI